MAPPPGGVITEPTPLGVWEAPFIWWAYTAAAVYFSSIAMVYVFQSRSRLRAWNVDHGKIPWIATKWGGRVNGLLYLFFIAFSSVSYWIIRGGHTYQNRVSVATTYYTMLWVFSMWSLPLVWHKRWLSTAILFATTGAYITYVVFCWIAKPWYGGVVAIAGCLVMIAILVAWMFDAPLPERQRLSTKGV